ncbi:MAG: hypothetical protein ACOCRX_11225 [Candidatus Woesearchaeota archaeon]
MGNVINLEEYRKKKEENTFKEFDEIYNEETENDFFDFLIEEDIDFDSLSTYTAFDDEFMERNIEHFVHNTFPHCSICDNQLKKGERVDSMWPQEYDFNLCNNCKEKLPESFKEERIINLDKIELIMAEDDFRKVEENLNEVDIIKIKGSRIILEKIYSEIKYLVLDLEKDLDF